MKVADILKEDSQLNEVAPLAVFGGLAATAVRAAAGRGVSWARQLLSKKPAGLAPTTQRAKDYREIRQILKKSGVSNPTAKAIAKAKISKIPQTTLSFLKWTLTLDYINDYFTEIADLEDQLEKVRAGDTTTAIFGAMSIQEAEKVANEYRNKRLAETVGVAMLSFGVVSKALNGLGYLGKLAGGAVGSATGSRALGTAATAGLAGAPRLAAMLAKLVEGGAVRNIALITFLKSDSGKKFLEMSVVDSLTQTGGMLLSATINLGIQALEAAGVSVPDAAKSKIAPPGDGAAAGAAAGAPAAAAMPPQLQVTRNPSNPKIMYINRVQVTDPNGYQFVGNNYLDGIKRFATQMKMPNHEVFGIQKDPNKVYDPYGFKAKAS